MLRMFLGQRWQLYLYLCTWLMVQVAALAYALSPEQLYALNCMGCHNVDGRGLEQSDGTSVPRLKDFVGYFLHLPEGRAFISQVPGVAFSGLNDEDSAKVLNWILLTQSAEQLPQDFMPYSAEEIAHYRQTPLVDGVKAARAVMIDKLFAQGIIPQEVFDSLP
ncbi:MAG: cytochrome c [Deinococcales bacterium]